MRSLTISPLPAALALLLFLGGCDDDASRTIAPPSGGGDTTTTAPPDDGDTPVAATPDYWPTVTWQTATPESQGFPAGALDTLAADAATALPYHTSLLVIRNGWLLHESYHDTTTDTGNTADSLHHVWSITKSVTALTLGRALTLGDLQWSQLEATVGDSLPAAAWNGLAADDSRLGIRLIDTLRMRSGLTWQEHGSLMQPGKDPMLRAVYGQEPNCPSGSEQVLCAILQQPLAYAPGTVWNYSTYDSYLISGFFTHLLADTVPDKRLAAYAKAHLFSPLGISANTNWLNLPAAYTFGGGTLNITSRDLAKLGLLTLYDGTWEGTRLIDAAWMELALTAQGEGEVATFDASGNPAAPVSASIPYGLQWWRGSGLGGSATISARGRGGQMMHIFRDKELIIIITCDDDVTYERSAEIEAFLSSHILDKLAG